MKNRKIITWAQDSLKDIKIAERQKTKLENDGWRLVHSEATITRGMLIYEREEQ